jgi:hypothetical protein
MNNKVNLFASAKCGCFSCGRVYMPADITEWTDKDNTAICPHCHIDSVIPENVGYPLDEEFLMAMNTKYFSVK